MENYVDNIIKGDSVYPVKDTVSGYVDKDVDDLTNYMTTEELEEALGEKATLADIPTRGQVAPLNQGYVTGGDVYQSLYSIQSRLNAI